MREHTSFLNKMIYLIRHGERADDGNQYEREAIVDDFDPHLTLKGYQQAHLTGLYF
jgi:broad specificity phosphatase PhoE